MFSSVDLPQPLGPTMATKAPAGTANDISSSARYVRPSGVSKSRDDASSSSGHRWCALLAVRRTRARPRRPRSGRGFAMGAMSALRSAPDNRRRRTGVAPGSGFRLELVEGQPCDPAPRARRQFPRLGPRIASTVDYERGTCPLRAGGRRRVFAHLHRLVHDAQPGAGMRFEDFQKAARLARHLRRPRRRGYPLRKTHASTACA